MLLALCFATKCGWGRGYLKAFFEVHELYYTFDSRLQSGELYEYSDSLFFIYSRDLHTQHTEREYAHY